MTYNARSHNIISFARSGNWKIDWKARTVKSLSKCKQACKSSSSCKGTISDSACVMNGFLTLSMPGVTWGKHSGTHTCVSCTKTRLESSTFMKQWSQPPNFYLKTTATTTTSARRRRNPCTATMPAGSIATAQSAALFTIQKATACSAYCKTHPTVSDCIHTPAPTPPWTGNSIPSASDPYADCASQGGGVRGC